MRKVKTFLHVFKNSLFPQATYYPKILRSSFGFSFKYFLTLILLLNLTFLFFLTSRFSPQKISTLLASLNSSLEKYPDDLTITIKDGRAIGNYNRPFFLWLDYQNKKELLFVFDESANPEKIKVYQALSLLTTQDLVFNFNQLKNNQPLSVIPLIAFSNLTVTKQNISQVTTFINKIIKNLFLIYLIITISAIVIIPLFSLIIILFYLILGTLIAFSIYKFILKKRIHFKKTFQISLHAVTFPLILDYLIIISKPAINLEFSIPFSGFLFPFSFLFLLSIFIFVGIYKAHISKNDKIGHEGKHDKM